MLAQTDFDFVRALVRERSAIILEPGSDSRVERRLLPILWDRRLESIAALVDQLRSAPLGDLARLVVEAATSNETSFFRDQHPFEAFRTRLLPDLLQRRGSERRLRVWSNACSSGQEAYSLAMLLDEHFPVLRGWDVSILATDISRNMVQRTQQGIYGQLEINQGLPAALLVRYFERHGAHWRVRSELRRWVQARELNLAEPWPALPRFDAIFLRNVLIYFDLPTRQTILRRVRQVLRRDGGVLIGSGEATALLDDGWEQVGSGASAAYRPVTGAGQAAGSAA